MAEDWQVLGELTAGEVALHELAELKNEVAQLRGVVVAEQMAKEQMQAKHAVEMQRRAAVTQRLHAEVAQLTERLAGVEQDGRIRAQSLHDEIAVLKTAQVAQESAKRQQAARLPLPQHPRAPCRHNQQQQLSSPAALLPCQLPRPYSAQRTAKTARMPRCGTDSRSCGMSSSSASRDPFSGLCEFL